MKLYNRYEYSEDNYRCELTKELDSLAKLSDHKGYRLFHHYILADDYFKKEKCLAIRIPGRSVGGIWFDDNNVITKIVIDTEQGINTYPDNVEELVQKFIGEVIEWEVT